MMTAKGEKITSASREVTMIVPNPQKESSIVWQTTPRRPSVQRVVRSPCLQPMTPITDRTPNPLFERGGCSSEPSSIFGPLVIIYNTNFPLTGGQNGEFLSICLKITKDFR